MSNEVLIVLCIAGLLLIFIIGYGLYDLIDLLWKNRKK